MPLLTDQQIQEIAKCIYAEEAAGWIPALLSDRKELQARIQKLEGLVGEIVRCREDGNRGVLIDGDSDDYSIRDDWFKRAAALTPVSQEASRGSVHKV